MFPNKQILAVVVLYKCLLCESHSYKTLLKDSDINLYVYDNSPEAQEIHLANVEYIHDATNSGLGVAYNRAAEYARLNGYQWLLLLDQDTTFPIGAMDKYRLAISMYHEIQLFAPVHQIQTGKYISPTHYFCKGSRPTRKLYTGMLSFDQVSPINSGLLISVSSFRAVGGYDEEVTLDFSDIRFIEKYKKMYSCFYVIPGIICLQDFSIQEKNTEKLMTRFQIFLNCALACKRESLFDRLAYLFVTAKRTVHLVWLTHKWSFLKKYISNYLLKKSV